jgi:hypothetical protein
MMDEQRNCPKHVEFYFQNKFEKLVHLVGFIIRKFITMHGHMNVKYNETYHKTHIISADIPYILRHQGAIIREFINSKPSLLHVLAIHPGHLQGATGLVYVCSVYGNLSRITGTLYRWSITKTYSYNVRTL